MVTKKADLLKIGAGLQPEQCPQGESCWEAVVGMLEHRESCQEAVVRIQEPGESCQEAVEGMPEPGELAVSDGSSTSGRRLQAVDPSLPPLPVWSYLGFDVATTSAWQVQHFSKPE